LPVVDVSTSGAVDIAGDSTARSWAGTTGDTAIGFGGGAPAQATTNAVKIASPQNHRRHRPCRCMPVPPWSIAAILAAWCNDDPSFVAGVGGAGQGSRWVCL